MAILGLNHNFLEGLSDFWQRFFADANQLDALYQGTAKLIGQAYLDLLSNVLGVSLKDVPVFNKEYFRLLTLREDEIRFERGTSSDDDRWVYTLQDGLVSFVSLDNRVIEPTAALQEDIDYDLVNGEVRFKLDPTDREGLPLSGYARRAVDVAVGGEFDDTTRTSTQSWLTRNVRKGDTLRLLDLSDDASQQTKRSDHAITVVRAASFFVSADAPLTISADPAAYIVLRKPADPVVSFEAFTAPGLSAIQLAHTRLDTGSVQVFAKAPGGEDVVEGVDYTVDYEHGQLYRLTSWISAPSYSVNYTWQQEVWPASGTAPRHSQTGIIRQGEGATTRVLQMALWAADTLIDRRVLANNFGALLGVEEDSSEAYRAFLRGIFQLYVLGPVLERIESALNVIVGLPVVRDDGEMYVSITTGTTTKTITTRRVNGSYAEYVFPLGALLRIDLIAGLELNSFEPLTTAITVTDYVQDPTWWHRIVIPEALFVETEAFPGEAIARRTVSTQYVKHVIGAPDYPRIGDPGFNIGADENGFIPVDGQPVLRHRLAYVLMERYLKHHMFFIRFDPSVLSSEGAQFSRPITELNDLVFSAKPAHTYLIVQSPTGLYDLALMEDGDGTVYYQPQRYEGADPDSAELFTEEPTNGEEFSLLGLSVSSSLDSPTGNPDIVLFTDGPMLIGQTVWTLGDFFHYQQFNETVNFAGTSPISLSHAASAPYHTQLVHVFVDGAIGGKRLVENVDYSVNYSGYTLTRITSWDVNGTTSVTYLQANIANIQDVGPDESLGEQLWTIGGADPAQVTGNFDPEAINWMDEIQPITDHRDLGMVERPLVISVISASGEEEPPPEEEEPEGLQQKIIPVSYWYALLSKWNQVITEYPLVPMTLVNPRRTPVDGNYVTQTNAIQASGMKAIGYVGTDYATGSKTTGDVIAEIDDHHAWYGFDGVFIDEVANGISNPATIPFYETVSDHIRTNYPDAFIIMNTGGNFAEAMVDFADTFMSRETSATSYLGWSGPPAWMLTYALTNPYKFWHCVHTCTGANRAAVLAKMRLWNIGYVYVTDDAATYAVLPTYWSTLITEVLAANAAA